MAFCQAFATLDCFQTHRDPWFAYTVPINSTRPSISCPFTLQNKPEWTLRLVTLLLRGVHFRFSGCSSFCPNAKTLREPPAPCRRTPFHHRLPRFGAGVGFLEGWKRRSLSNDGTSTHGPWFSSTCHFPCPSQKATLPAQTTLPLCVSLSAADLSPPPGINITGAQFLTRRCLLSKAVVRVNSSRIKTDPDAHWAKTPLGRDQRPQAISSWNRVLLGGCCQLAAARRCS